MLVCSLDVYYLKGTEVKLEGVKRGRGRGGRGEMCCSVLHWLITSSLSAYPPYHSSHSTHFPTYYFFLIHLQLYYPSRISVPGKHVLFPLLSLFPFNDWTKYFSRIQFLLEGTYRGRRRKLRGKKKWVEGKELDQQGTPSSVH